MSFVDAALNAEASRRGLTRPQAELAIFLESLKIDLAQALIAEPDFPEIFVFGNQANVNRFLTEMDRLRSRCNKGELTFDECCEIAKSEALKGVANLTDADRLEWLIRLREYQGPCGHGAVSVKALLGCGGTVAGLAAVLDMPQTTAYRVGKPLLIKWRAKFPRAEIEWNKTAGDWRVTWV